MKIEKNSLIKSKSDILSTFVGEEMVLMSLDDDSYINLNPMAAQIWEMINNEAVSFKSIIDQLLLKYNVDRGTCADHSLSFLNQLLEKNLINID